MGEALAGVQPQVQPDPLPPPPPGGLVVAPPVPPLLLLFLFFFFFFLLFLFFLFSFFFFFSFFFLLSFFLFLFSLFSFSSFFLSFFLFSLFLFLPFSPCRCRARLPGRYRAGRNAHANTAARTIRTTRAMAYLSDHEGSPLRAARTALRRAARAAPGFRSAAGARAALIAATRSSGMEARGPCRSVTKERNRAVLVAFRGTVPPPGPAGPGRRQGGAGGAAAGGDRAFLEHPGAEPGQGRGRRQGQAQQPQDQAAEDGQRGGRVGGQRGGQLLVAGQRPGRHADEGVAGQGVGDRRHGPDGQVPPARRGRDRVHEHAGGDRGQVQRPGPERAAAVQGQRDAQAGEDQRGGVRDRGLQGGDHRQVAGGVDHPVLGGEAHRRRGRGQDAQPGRRVAQPQARTVPGPPGRGGLAAGAGRPGRPDRP